MLLRTKIHNAINSLYEIRSMISSHLRYLGLLPYYQEEQEQGDRSGSDEPVMLQDCYDIINQIDGTKTLNTIEQTNVAGYKYATINTNGLVPGNIVNGIAIFGVVGTYNITQNHASDYLYLYGGATRPHASGLIQDGQYRVGVALQPLEDRTLLPWNVKKDVTLMGVTGQGNSLQIMASSALSVNVITEWQSINLVSSNLPLDAFYGVGYVYGNIGTLYEGLDAQMTAGAFVILMLLESIPIPLDEIQFQSNGDVTNYMVSMNIDNIDITKVVYGTTWLSVIFDHQGGRRLSTAFVPKINDHLRWITVYNVDYGISMFNDAPYMEIDTIERSQHIFQHRDIIRRLLVEAKDKQTHLTCCPITKVPYTGPDGNALYKICFYISEGGDDCPFEDFKYYYVNSRHVKQSEFELPAMAMILFISDDNTIDSETSFEDSIIEIGTHSGLDDMAQYDTQMVFETKDMYDYLEDKLIQ